MSAATGEFELLTGVGPAAICCIAASGDAVRRFVSEHIRAKRGDVEPWRGGDVIRATLVDGEAAIDDILVTVHQVSPALSIRLHLHGGPWIGRRCCELLAAAGLRERGDETESALPLDEFIDAEMHRVLPRVQTLAGVTWLVGEAQRLRAAIAVAMAIANATERRARLIELSRGAHRMRWFTEPYRIALVGAPNAGKSTLLNALAGEATSIVSEIPGTTRDWVEAPGEIGGFPVTWIDTAGLRDAADEIEAEGIARTRRLVEASDAVVLLIDPTGVGADAGAISRTPDVVLLTKTDRSAIDHAAFERGGQHGGRPIAISAITGHGLDEFKAELLRGMSRELNPNCPGAFTGAVAQRVSGLAGNT
ncbi:MAG: GTPase [Phycisphaerae bacterium]